MSCRSVSPGGGVGILRGVVRLLACRTLRRPPLSCCNSNHKTNKSKSAFLCGTHAHRLTEREREACAPPLSHTHTHTTLHTLVTAELMVDDGINHKQQIELEMKPRSPTQRTTHTHARVRFSSGSLCLLGCLLDWLLGCVWVWAVLLFGAPTRMDGSFQDFGAVEPRQKIYLSALPTRKFK